MSETLHSTTGPSGTSELGKETNPCDTAAAIDAIQRPKQLPADAEPTTDQWLPRMDLPGFGQLGETCGEEVTQFCECCADTWSVGETCRRSTCPRCAQTWVRESATQIAAKLKATWAKRYASESEHPFFQHMVVDIPNDWKLAGDPETVYWRTLDMVKEIMDAFGIAGVPIYHPYRGESEESDDRGEWSRRLFDDKDWNEVSEELEFDPHFHVVGVAPYVDCSGVEEIQDTTGVPIHRITQEDSNISIGNDYDMAGVVAYCLSHAGIYEDSNGDMSAAAHTRVAERPWRQDGFLDGNAPTIQDRTRKEMDEIVRSVAPRVLGVEYSSVACLREVPEEAAADSELSLSAGSMDYQETGEGDGDGSATDDDPDEEGEVRLVKCEGRSLHIRKAPRYLSDEDWRETADYATQLEIEHEEWKRSNGIV